MSTAYKLELGSTGETQINLIQSILDRIYWHVGICYTTHLPLI